MSQVHGGSRNVFAFHKQEPSEEQPRLEQRGAPNICVLQVYAELLLPGVMISGRALECGQVPSMALHE